MKSWLTFQPASKNPEVVLPQQGNVDNVNNLANPLPYSVYVDDPSFKEGAVEQVNFTFTKLGGRTLDIELSEYDVYTHYQEACIEFANLLNMYHGKDILPYALGTDTGIFDSEGNLLPGSDVAPGTHLELKYPRVNMTLARRFADAVSSEAHIGGSEPVYRAAIDVVPHQQDYDLQAIIYEQSQNDPTVDFYNKIKNGSRVYVHKVYYKTPLSMWRFYGFYGAGLTVLGNLASYGMWSDDSSFQVIPVWQNRLQAASFMESMQVRMSHYSYELKGNKLRIFPIPSGISPQKYWVEFQLDSNPFEAANGNTGNDGVNSIATLAFEYIPYNKVNGVGKRWVAKYALALSKETLAYNRTKIGAIPFANGSVTLNGDKLWSEAKEDQKALREELIKLLTETGYGALLEQQAKAMDAMANVKKYSPARIFVG